MWASLDPAKTQARIDEGKAAKCCYAWVESCPGGRPLLVDDEAIVAPLRPGDGWSTRSVCEADEHPRAHELASGWSADAQAEHAAIASFARFVLELMSVGAPPHLLAGAARAAEDEVAHARACLAMAQRHGLRVEFEPLPAAAPRDVDLCGLAVDTLIEGVLGETNAALLAAMMVERTASEEVRAVWEKIAEDEARHAALAWSTLEWATSHGGAPVREALRAAARTITPALVDVPEDRELVALGRPDASLCAAARLRAWERLVLPRLRSLTAEGVAEPRMA
jgi:hypothetical protein